MAWGVTGGSPCRRSRSTLPQRITLRLNRRGFLAGEGKRKRIAGRCRVLAETWHTDARAQHPLRERVLLVPADAPNVLAVACNDVATVGADGVAAGPAVDEAEPATRSSVPRSAGSPNTHSRSHSARASHVRQFRHGTRRGERPQKCERATIPSGGGKPCTGSVLARSSRPLGGARQAVVRSARLRVLSCRALAELRHASRACTPPVFACACSASRGVCRWPIRILAECRSSVGVQMCWTSCSAETSFSTRTSQWRACFVLGRRRAERSRHRRGATNRSSPRAPDASPPQRLGPSPHRRDPPPESHPSYVQLIRTKRLHQLPRANLSQFRQTATATRSDASGAKPPACRGCLPR